MFASQTANGPPSSETYTSNDATPLLGDPNELSAPPPPSETATQTIVERFRSREAKTGEVLIKEGEQSDGLYVVLAGVIDIKKRKEGVEVLAGRLHEGDIFGEISCLRKGSAAASVVMQRNGTLLRLPRQSFDELVVTYPQILELISELASERADNLDAILSGQAEFTDDGLVLV